MTDQPQVTVKFQVFDPDPDYTFTEEDLKNLGQFVLELAEDQRNLRERGLLEGPRE